jgi:hypothetical protein
LFIELKQYDPALARPLRPFSSIRWGEYSFMMIDQSVGIINLNRDIYYNRENILSEEKCIFSVQIPTEKAS